MNHPEDPQTPAMQAGIADQNRVVYAHQGTGAQLSTRADLPSVTARADMTLDSLSELNSRLRTILGNLEGHEPPNEREVAPASVPDSLQDRMQRIEALMNTAHNLTERISNHV